MLELCKLRTRSHVISRCITCLHLDITSSISASLFDMSRSRSITDFFDRPRFPSTSSKPPQLRASNPSKAHTTSSQSPSRVELSSPLAESNPSTSSDTPAENCGTHLKEPLLDSAGDKPAEKASRQTFKSARTTRDSSVGGSFSSSQRLVRDGIEIVTGTDSEETDSVESLEDVDELLRRFTCPKDNYPEKPSKGSSTDTRVDLRPKCGKPQSKFSPSETVVPKYKNTLDRLVTEAVDDHETEAGVAKLKAAIEAENSWNGADARPDGRQERKLREDMLAAALGDMDDELGLERLLDAVRRTEAFEQEKSWLFFDHEADVPPPREFPRDAISPGTPLAGLRG